MSLLSIQDTDVFRNSIFSPCGKTLIDGFSVRFWVMRNFLETKEFSKPSTQPLWVLENKLSHIQSFRHFPPLCNTKYLWMCPFSPFIDGLTEEVLSLVRLTSPGGHRALAGWVSLNLMWTFEKFWNFSIWRVIFSHVITHFGSDRKDNIKI